MNNGPTDETLLLDEHHLISWQQLVDSSGFSQNELSELIDYGVLIPTNTRITQPTQWTFSAHCIVALKTANRLRHDFELDPHALALTLKFIERIHELEAQLCELRAQLPRRFS